jgi:hypothetical protein
MTGTQRVGVHVHVREVCGYIPGSQYMQLLIVELWLCVLTPVTSQIRSNVSWFCCACRCVFVLDIPHLRRVCWRVCIRHHPQHTSLVHPGHKTAQVPRHLRGRQRLLAPDDLACSHASSHTKCVADVCKLAAASTGLQASKPNADARAGIMYW